MYVGGVINKLLRQYLATAEQRLPLLMAMAIPQVTWSFGDHPHFKKKRGYAVMLPLEQGHYHILFAYKAKKLKDAHILEGLILHELGHVFDMAFGIGITDEINPHAKVISGLFLPMGPERRADFIASVVFNRHIYYDRHGVQTTSWDEAYIRPERLGL